MPHQRMTTDRWTHQDSDSEDEDASPLYFCPRGRDDQVATQPTPQQCVWCLWRLDAFPFFVLTAVPETVLVLPGLAGPRPALRPTRRSQ